MVRVATVLTVYGIETLRRRAYICLKQLVATVLTVYGIETDPAFSASIGILAVATVLTVYGIETNEILQSEHQLYRRLQQYLPFTVLKPDCCEFEKDLLLLVATVLTVYGIETGKMPPMLDEVFSSCNSTYRLRY